MPTADQADALAGQIAVDEAKVALRTRAHIAGDEAAELGTGVAQGNDDECQGPLGHWIRRAVGRIDRADAPRPGGLDVDAAGKAVAFQLADDLQVGGLIQDLRPRLSGSRGRRPSRRNCSSRSPSAWAVSGICVGVVNAAAFAFEPVPVGEGFEACEIGRGEVLLAHVLVAGDEYLGT